MGPQTEKRNRAFQHPILAYAFLLVILLAHGGCHPVQKESVIESQKPDDARYNDTIAHHQRKDWSPEAVIPAPPGVEDDIRKWHDDEPVQGADTNENEELLHHGKHSSIQDHQRREKLHPDDPHGYDEHSHHHDSALKVSSVFPVDPTELETTVHRQAHHSAPAELNDGSTKREKRDSNLLADAETMLWIEDQDGKRGKPFPEDLSNY